MMIKKMPIILCCILSSCFDANAQYRSKLSGQLAGEWQNVYVKIIDRQPNAAPDTMEADSTNWE